MSFLDQHGEKCGYTGARLHLSTRLLLTSSVRKTPVKEVHMWFTALPLVLKPPEACFPGVCSDI
jgi:hypothetical protein